MSPEIIIPKLKEKISFSGIGLYINEDSKLLIPILSSESNHYIKNEFKQQDKVESSVVVAAFQGRNNARAAFTGSLDICSNPHMTDDSKGNLKFCIELTKWTMGLKGLLRYSNITNHRIGEKHQKGFTENEYTINENIYYSIDIEEFKAGKWQEFKTDKGYVELVMLDPKIRKYLSYAHPSHFTTFQAPDVHGVYQFKFYFHEPGYSWINTATKATIRPYKHDKYERFLPCAYPYYSSVFASIGGFLVFSFLFLYHKDT